MYTRPLFLLKLSTVYQHGLASAVCTAADRVRLDSFLRRCTKFRYISASNPPSVSCMLENAEDKLFHKIISDSQHVLQSYLTDQADVSYNLQP